MRANLNTSFYTICLFRRIIKLRFKGRISATNYDNFNVLFSLNRRFHTKCFSLLRAIKLWCKLFLYTDLRHLVAVKEFNSLLNFIWNTEENYVQIFPLNSASSTITWMSCEIPIIILLMMLHLKNILLYFMEEAKKTNIFCSLSRFYPTRHFVGTTVSIQIPNILRLTLGTEHPDCILLYY
jgi:hypothetical protein